MQTKSLKQIFIQTISITALTIVLSPCIYQQSVQAIVILPLGDSITQSDTAHASYRYWLWQLFMNNGYTSSTVDFIGSRSCNFNLISYGCTPAPYTNFDADHEGHWGYLVATTGTLIGVRDSIVPWALSYPAAPDIALIHLGTNDMLSLTSPADSAINHLGQVIDSLRVVNPSIKIALSKIIPNPGTSSMSQIQNPARINAFNTLIPALAASKNTIASPVIVVDQFTGFETVDLYDRTHPYETGEKKMAARFFDAVCQLTGTNPPPQVILTAPHRNWNLTGARDTVITAMAWDVNDTIVSVDFYVNNLLIEKDSVSPYSVRYTPLNEDDTIHIVARAVNRHDLVSQDSIDVRVQKTAAVINPAGMVSPHGLARIIARNGTIETNLDFRCSGLIRLFDIAGKNLAEHVFNNSRQIIIPWQNPTAARMVIVQIEYLNQSEEHAVPLILE